MLYADARSCVCGPCGEIAFQISSERGESLRRLVSSGGKGNSNGLEVEDNPCDELAQVEDVVGVWVLHALMPAHPSL